MQSLYCRWIAIDFRSHFRKGIPLVSPYLMARSRHRPYERIVPLSALSFRFRRSLLVWCRMLRSTMRVFIIALLISDAVPLLEPLNLGVKPCYFCGMQGFALFSLGSGFSFALFSLRSDFGFALFSLGL